MAEPFTPETYVKLYANVPLDNTYKNTLDFFKTQTDQIAFFENYLKNGFVNFTYQRERRAIRVPLVYDLVSTVNYCAYQNSNFTKKWFFAFVTEVRYVNPSCTELIIEQDVFQTWLFDYSVRQSFIEREHVENDTIGAHTIPEGLETGPYVTTTESNYRVTDLGLYIMSTDNLGQNFWNDPGLVGGLPVPCYWVSLGRISDFSAEILKIILDSAAQQGKADAIVSIFTAPWNMVSTEPAVRSFPWSLANRVTTATPRNNKLLTYPYTSLSVVAGGLGMELKYELFKDPLNPECVITGGFGPNMQVSCIPSNYENQEENMQNTISIRDFPLLPWVTNYYQNWLAQNELSLAVNTITGLTSAGLGFAAIAASDNASAGTGMISSGFNQVVSQMVSIYQHSIIPDKMQGNLDAGNIHAASGRAGFFSYCRTIRPEYLKIIDDYFHMYGYKVNRVGVSNTKSRLHWNYVKTIGVTIFGNLPQDHLNVIKSAYDNGITFWHDSGVSNYNQPNPIVNVG